MAEYTDLKGKRHEIINTVPLTDEEKAQLEDEIVEQLFEIFTGK